jgi:fucose permease
VPNVPRHLGWSLVTCNLAMMVLAIAVNLLPVFLTSIAADLGRGSPLSAEQLGRIGAVTFIGLVGGILVTGPLADRWGAKIFAVGGNALIAVGLLALRWTTDYQMLLGAAFVGGVGAGILDMILSPIVSSLTRGQSQTRALNVLHSFYCIGAIMTILAGSLALRSGLGWRTLALWLSPMPVVVGVAMCLLPMPSLVEGGLVRIATRQLVRQRFFLLTMVAIFLGGAMELGMAYWLPAYAEKSLGYSPWIAGLAFLGFSLAMTLGRLGMMFLPKTVEAIQLMLFCVWPALCFFRLLPSRPFQDWRLRPAFLWASPDPASGQPPSPWRRIAIRAAERRCLLCWEPSEILAAFSCHGWLVWWLTIGACGGVWPARPCVRWR